MTLDIRALSLSLPSFAPRLTTVNEVSERGERSAGEEVARPRCPGYRLPAFRRHLVLFVRLGFNLVIFLSTAQ